MCYSKPLDQLDVIIVKEFKNVLQKVYGETKAVPGIRDNCFHHVENIVENILVNVKVAVANFDHNNC